MSDYRASFVVSNKLYSKKPTALYSNINSSQNQHAYKPQDVISTVKNQLKAIHNADSSDIKRTRLKDIEKYKKSTFLSVNNLFLPDVKVPKETKKFDTQITDTQLMNIVEDAELNDEELKVDKGMTQEFETAFVHANTEKQDSGLNDTNNSVGKMKHQNTKDTQISDDIVQFNSVSKICDTEIDNIDNMHTKPNNNPIETSSDNNSKVEKLSQILQIKVNSFRTKTTINKNMEHKSDEESEISLIIPENRQLDFETTADLNIQTPESPIFVSKNIKLKSKSPSPLVFNLEQFEEFATMALSFLSSDHFNISKNVINSQILNKELHLNIDQDMGTDVLNLSPVQDNDQQLEQPITPIHIPKELKMKDISSTHDILNESPKRSKTDGAVKTVNVKNVTDEILFSSDEENYSHKEFKDLPFTCAVDNSFYNQSDILDKTLYVGFQTASNRSIQVSAESFTRAKNLLDETAEDQISITELVKSYDSIDKGKSVMDEVKLNNENMSLKLDVNNVTVPQANYFKMSINNQVGFMTASNKNISLSEKALARCKKVFQDIDLNEDFDCVDIKEINSESNNDHNQLNFNKYVINSVSNAIESIDDDIIQEFENIEMSLKDSKDEKIILKAVPTNTISVGTFNEIGDKEVLKQIDLEDVKEYTKEKKPNSLLSQIIEIRKNKTDCSKLNVKVKDNSEFIHKQKQNYDVAPLSVIENRGFDSKTVSNKNINISDNIFKDIERSVNKYGKLYPVSINEQRASKTFPGFETAYNKNILVSDKAWKRSEVVFHEIDSLELPTKLSKSHTEDPIPNDNTVKNSLKEKKIMYDDLIKPALFTTGYVGFKSASNKVITISDEALVKTRDIFGDIDLCNKHDSKRDYKDMALSSTNICTDTKFVGFRTANNKNIHISKDALVKTNAIFKDIDSVDIEITGFKDHQEKPDISSQASKLKKISVIEIQALEFDSTEKLKTLPNSKDNADIRLENEIRPEIQTNCIKMTPTILPFKGFHTANNRPISVSAKALETSKQMFVNVDCNSAFAGFQTASNKKLQISEEALRKSRKIFQDLNNIENICDENKRTSVKKLYPDEIRQEDKIDLEINDNPNFVHKDQTIGAFQCFQTEITPTILPFQGIHTANNKPISVSAKALETSKQMFDNIDCNTAFSGFQTASNKKVQISEEALRKSRKIFQDLNNIENISDENKLTSVKKRYPDEIRQEDKIDIEINDNPNFIQKDHPIGAFQSFQTEMPPTILPFKGFQTADNKPVSVSAKVLEKGKQMFVNIDCNKVFAGFQTASNKKVQISEEALRKSNTIFQDLNNIENICDENKSTSVKKLYPGEMRQEDKVDKDNTSGAIQCFKTASKKSVAISKTALVKSKEIFKDLDERNHETVTDNRNLSEMFLTASSKKVLVSEDALVKRKKIFRDIDIRNSRDEKDIVKSSNFQLCFQTGHNQSITVSENALAKSKRMFSEIDYECSSRKRDKKDHVPEDINTILNTQVVNNFETSLHTEDFIVTPKNCKRPGSPILSCPRAKKRKKFETPYSVKNIQKPLEAKPKEEDTKQSVIAYKHDYKKNKTLTLQDVNNMTKPWSRTIDPYLLNFGYGNLLDFEFNNKRNELLGDNMTINELKKHFLNSVNSKLVPDGWLDNHLKLIMWKLVSYEIKFKSAIVCTIKNVLDQLKFRYDKELYNAQRPALRKILEKDDVPSKTIVLCVSGIYVDDVLVTRVTNSSSNIELLLTDGWYSIRCHIDRLLKDMVGNGKITVGCKLITSGAEVTGSEQGVAPWEDTSAVRLKIFGNSTRRAHWDTRLGYIKHGPILCPLSSIQVSGGKVSKLRVFITRVYPALYVEKFEDGSTVTRSERLENIHQMKMETERQVYMEKLYEEVEKEFADQEFQDSGGLSDSYKRICMDSGSQIAKLIKKSKDPMEFRAQLTESQQHLLESHTAKNRDRLLEDIQNRVRDRIEKDGVCGSRNVISLLKIRVVGVTEKADRVDVRKGMMSIWKPTEAVQEVIKEGTWIDVLNVVPTAVRYCEIQMSAGRQSVFSTSRYKEPEKFKLYTKVLQRQCYHIKDLAQNPSMATDYNEIDTIGLIFLIEPSIKEFDSRKQSFQNVYLADIDKNVICVNFWGGLQKFGFQNVLDTGQVITCVNLQKRAGNTRKSIPQFRVTEFSYFTQTPKSDIARNMLNKFNKNIIGLDRRKFCEDCLVIKNNYLCTKNMENISPYRFINTNINTSMSKRYVESPLLRPIKIEDSFNLNVLDFESTFKQDSQLSEEMLKRKSKVNEKIARLKMYGEPPPLSLMHIINITKKASCHYKSPLISADNNSKNIEFVNENSNATADNVHSKLDSLADVTSSNKTPLKRGVQYENNSPVLLNRTYIKCRNPVKINFDMQENNDSHVDHFADDFDGSPPLSLD